MGIITTQIKNNLENYSQIIDDDGGNQKEYKTKIKTFLENKKENENKVQKELSDLISFSKNKVDFLIKKLPALPCELNAFPDQHSILGEDPKISAELALGAMAVKWLLRNPLPNVSGHSPRSLANC